MTEEGRAERALKKLDRHPVLDVIGAAIVVFLGLSIWACLSDPPILLARASAGTRADFYGEMANSSVAMLAVSLTVLAILVSLPDRDRVRELKAATSWMLVLWTLLAAAAFSLLTLVLAHVASGVDVAHDGKQWLESWLLASAFGALLALVIGGAGFALVIKAGHREADRTAGRGTGRA